MMKNEFLFWMAILPSCHVVVTGLVVELIIEMPLNWSDTLTAIQNHYLGIELRNFSFTNLK